MNDGSETPTPTRRRKSTSQKDFAATTPRRRSMVDLMNQLNELFATYTSSANENDNDHSDDQQQPGPTAAPPVVINPLERTIPLAALPGVIETFEKQRGAIILTQDEKDKLQELALQLPHENVTADMLLSVIAATSATATTSVSAESPLPEPSPSVTSSSPSVHSTSTNNDTSSFDNTPGTSTMDEYDEDGQSEIEYPEADDQVPDSPTMKTHFLNRARGAGAPLLASASSSSPPALMRPDPFDLVGDGSPLPKRRSSVTDSQRTSTDTSVLLTGSTTSNPSTPYSRNTGMRKKRSFMSGKLTFGASPIGQITASSSTSSNQEGYASSVDSRRASTSSSNASYQQNELANAVAARGGTYLGVPLDGPIGQLDVDAEADKLRSVIITSPADSSRDKEVANILASKTWPQIRAIDRSYESRFGATLLEYVTSQKGIKTDLEYTLRGLIMGPLSFDIFLLTRALESVTVNTSTLIDVLVGRPPSAVALLRAAYRYRSSSTSATTTGSIGSRHKTLNAAVLASASSNAKLKKAWEVVLQGKWEDADEDGGSLLLDDAKRREMLNNDLDMLKVALRKGGNSDIVTKILLARSPSHIHALAVEYRDSSPLSLTQSIKQVYSSSSPLLAKMLLFVVENGKKDGAEAPGVWRDAKQIEVAIEGGGPGAAATARHDLLALRIIRLHWDRTRFRLVQQAYRQKYKKALLDRVTASTADTVGPASMSTTLREALKSAINSAQLPEPEMTPDDEQRLAALTKTTKKDDSTTIASTELIVQDSVATSPTELEAVGELSDPPSPRSSSPELSSSRNESFQGSSRSGSSTSSPTIVDSRPAMSPSISAPELHSSSSSSTGNRPSLPSSSSSLSFLQRSSPLEPLGHRSGSSSRGSLDGSANSLRHARPIAPARRRRPSEDLSKSTSSSGSLEPLSPMNSGLRSGSTSPSFARSPTPTTMMMSSADSSFQFARERHRSSTPTEQQHMSQLQLARPPSRSRRTSSSSSPIPFSAVDDESSAAVVTSPAAISTIDTTSYYATPISPIKDADEEEAAAVGGGSPSMTSNRFFLPESPETPQSHSMRREASTASSSSSSGASRPGSIFQVEGVGLGGDFQLANLSFENSPFSGRNDPESTQSMWRYATELSKKHKELEGRLQASATSYEEQISDLEGRLDEVRAELIVKRREEKDLRSNERQHLQQIASLEGEVSKLTKQLEKGRESYEAMKKNYLNQCEEAEKLRSLVAETRRENRAAEEAAHAHSIQVQQFERDRELLQGAISRLETDLAIATQAQDTLDSQKQENLVLKETIDRLRFDLEEMQSATRKSGFLDHGASASPDRSLVANSMSRSLGKELARRLAQQSSTSTSTIETTEEGSEAEESTSGSEDDDENDVNETIVTTHRTIHKKKKKTKRSSTVTQSEPLLLRHVEKTIVLADVETQTEEAAAEMKPEMRSLGVQTELSAISVPLVIAPLVDCSVSAVVAPAPPSAPPSPPPPKLTEAELRKQLAQELGIDIKQLDRAVELSKSGGDLLLARQQAMKATAAPIQPATLLPPREHFGARRATRYLTRISTRAAVEAPQLFINVFPGFAKPYVAQILESSMSFFLYSLTVYLTGFVSGTFFSPITHHHHFAPFQVFGHGDVAQNALWGEGMVLGSAAGGHANEGFASWLERLVWNGVSVVRRVPT